MSQSAEPTVPALAVSEPLTVRALARRYAFPLWKWYVGGLFSLAVTTLITLEVPQFEKAIVNRLTAHLPTSAEAQTALLIIGLGVLQMLVRALSRVLIFWPGRQIESAIKTHVFRRLMRLPQSFYQKHGMGDLISRLANDVGQIRVFFAFGLLQVLNLCFLLVFIIGKMLSVHVVLTMACLAPLLGMLGVMRFAMPRMHKFSLENQAALGKLTNRVTEAFLNVQVVQANAAEAAFIERAEVENERVYDTNIKVVVLRTVVFPLMTCLAGLSQLVVLFYGGYETLNGRLTVGDILAFNVYIGMLSFPLAALGMILAMYQRMRTSLRRLGEIESAKEEPAPMLEAKAPRPWSPRDPFLDIRDLTYTRLGQGAESSSFGLDHVNLRIYAGQRLGVFGRIGSGKTTLFSLITRLEEPPAGTIFWKGRDVVTMSPAELRQEIGYAMQVVHLFSDTVAQNLALGREGKVTSDDLALAAEGAAIRNEIEGFKDGWQTQVGEKGVRLSGGQKQRLSLARILLRRPELMLLDDVMSAVDQQTEKRLIDYLYGQRQTMMIASHRASVLAACDEMIILDQGRVIDRGRFSDLSQRHQNLLMQLTDQPTG